MSNNSDKKNPLTNDDNTHTTNDGGKMTIFGVHLQNREFLHIS